VPLVFAQLRHDPVQLVLQQRPSTQLPDAHSQFELHVAPLDFSATQLPVPVELEQYALVLQAEEQVPPEQLELQLPLDPQVYWPQPFSGSVPAGRLVQVPRLPARLQARQGPVHVVLQQRPSTQLPEAHSQPKEHVAPLDFSATHVPEPVAAEQ
jgi:hypothetical protein